MSATAMCSSCGTRPATDRGRCFDCYLEEDLRPVHEAEFVDKLAAGINGHLGAAPFAGEPGVPGLSLPFVDGAAFFLDAPAHVGAVWGTGTEVLWPEGEPFMLYGPDGVGKTTIAQQLMLRRIGIGEPELLGYPVTVTESKLLYLALDRPKQAMRSGRRMLSDEHREALAERLVVWDRSIPFDVVRQPEMLVTFARELGAGTVVIDSLKDFAAKLSDEDTGMAVSRAWQQCVEAGVEVLSLHHPRKAQGDNKKPRALADVYGSRWLSASCGSVLLVWGDAGDPVVDLEHLKQPADVVGPFKALHDNRAGTTTISEDDGPDAVTVALNWPPGAAPSAREVAARMLGKPSEQVKPNEKEKVRRRLAIGVSKGLLRTVEIVEDGRDVVLYMPSEGPHA
jgi:replicative DNA helicase